MATTTGSVVLIDSSRTPAGLLRLRDSKHELRVVHVVRDGRGYLRRADRAVSSWGDPLRRRVRDGGLAGQNLLIGSLLRSRLGTGQVICRYEDLIANPGQTLQRICAFAGLDATGWSTR